MKNIWTIGHSNKHITELIKKLKENKIDILVDVRTKPFSRWCPQFNMESVKINAEMHKIKYDWRGKNLGGLGKNVDWEKTLNEISKLSSKKRICLMCSEADYNKCHRHSKIEPELIKRKVLVTHILWDNVAMRTSMF